MARCESVWILGLDLFDRQTLPFAIRELTQVGYRLNRGFSRTGQDSGAVHGAVEIAGVDRGKAPIVDSSCERGNLELALLAERNVGMALDPPGLVPRGLAVPHEVPGARFGCRIGRGGVVHGIASTRAGPGMRWGSRELSATPKIRTVTSANSLTAP